MNYKGSIGVFDSGFGGLTILKDIVEKLPQYNYVYLGDNARSPYGNRSFETIYEYTKECVEWFFNNGCDLVILACNTASAKALRTIQQNFLPSLNNNNKRVLGVIRPTTEKIGYFTKTKSIGILATQGTVNSNSYAIEINNFFSDLKVYQQACPMLVPLIENNEHHSIAANYFVKKYLNELLDQSKQMDAILLACTHYPLLYDEFRKYAPENTTIITQGSIVADSLNEYLKRQSTIENTLIKEGNLSFFTTDSTEEFNKQASIFFGKEIKSQFCHL